ncbi:MAG: radical SAM family heme chaperone HemW [Thermanaerothrix sp.]|nr:radical SAM family heme chaperone HemW [Thermanaerothrix sp.]
MESEVLGGDLSLYVHVPFCVRKCLYCSFPSAPMGPLDEELYVDALCDEMASWARHLKGRKLFSLYVGGGTPSRLSCPAWERVLKRLWCLFDPSDLKEVTFEANPESLSISLLRTWTDLCPIPIRLSLGVQSFCDLDLLALGRPHTVKDAKRACDMVLSHGLSLSLDIMFRLPCQTIKGFAVTLKEAVRSGAEHLSAYELSIEEGTPYSSMNLNFCEDGYVFYRYLQWYLANKGFVHYEISNFALNRAFRLHNLRYWLGGDFLGIGPGAWSCIGGARYRNASDLKEWARLVDLSGKGVDFGEFLSDKSRRAERAVLRLRTIWGLRPESEDEPMVAVLSSLEDDLVQRNRDLSGRDVYRLTPRGFRVANRIWGMLLPDD